MAVLAAAKILTDQLHELGGVLVRVIVELAKVENSQVLQSRAEIVVEDLAISKVETLLVHHVMVTELHSIRLLRAVHEQRGLPEEHVLLEHVFPSFGDQLAANRILEAEKLQDLDQNFQRNPVLSHQMIVVHF